MVSNQTACIRQDDKQWKTIDNLMQFLKVFQSATQVLSGTKFQTISLVLLFWEIITALTNLSSDCKEVKSLKESMDVALHHRLPLTDLNAAPAMLDPCQQALQQNHLHLWQGCPE